MFGSRDNDTICSVSTPNGVGGISVIRVSGKLALSIIQSVLKKPIKKISTHRVYYNSIIDPKSGDTIDDVCITTFLNGKSFTGEEVIEISCHGSPVICKSILDLLCSCGARIAERGEFTYRGFLNNKIDLVQAESVLSVIHSKTELSSKLALKQLRGDLSKKVSDIEENLLWSLAHIEAGIDFSAEDIEVVDNRVLNQKLLQIKSDVSDLLKSFKYGKMISDGVQITLSGKPNTGKSSLMNLFLQEDRSIISSKAGTTRDVIKEEFLFDGLRFILADTAGIRSGTDDEIEIVGINKTLKEQKEAHINLFVLDLFDQRDNFDFTQLNNINNFDLDNIFIILNKADLSFTKNEFSEHFITDNEGLFSAKLDFLIQFLNNLEAFLLTKFDFSNSQAVRSWIKEHVLVTSTVYEIERVRLLSKIKKNWLGQGASNIENISVSSSRQYESLKQAAELIDKSLLALEEGLGYEFVAFDLKESLLSVQKILGIVYDDQILDKVFKEFCLGK